MIFRATSRPESGLRYVAGRDHVRYDVSAPWPGITWGFDARCHSCCWAMHQGVYQVKRLWADCPNHRRAVRRG